MIDFRKCRRFLHCFAFVMLSLNFYAAADGLPGEFLLSSRWRDLMWWHSPLTNPAFLTEEDRITVRGAFAPVLQGEFKLWELGATLPIGLNQAAGVSFIGENDGTIQESVFDPDANRLVAGGSERSNNNLFTMLSYAIIPWNRLSMGANVNVAYQSGFGEPVGGLGFDLGFAYSLIPHERLGNHLFGISTVNLISPAMDSKAAVGSAAYSRDLRMSWIGDFWKERIESGLDLDVRDFWAHVGEFSSLDEAIDVSKTLEWGCAWRGGIWIWRAFGTYLQLGFDERGMEYWGMAAGSKVPLAHGRGEVSAYYQYNIKTEGRVASSHTFYVITNFGKSRKEKRAASEMDTVARVKKGGLDDLRKIKGLKIEEDQEYIRITAEEIAIHFASGSADLPPEASDILKSIAQYLRTYPDNPASIEGHTDSMPIKGRLRARFPDNQALSKARCNAVKEYFVETENLSPDMFITKGYGETKPVVPNDTDQNKYRNRRVVITIQKQPVKNPKR